MKRFIRIGVDLAKNYFSVHALESEGERSVTRKLTRAGMFKFFAGIGSVPRRHGGLRLGAPEPDEGTGRANSRRWAMK